MEAQAAAELLAEGRAAADLAAVASRVVECLAVECLAVECQGVECLAAVNLENSPADQPVAPRVRRAVVPREVLAAVSLLKSWTRLWTTPLTVLMMPLVARVKAPMK